MITETVLNKKKNLKSYLVLKQDGYIIHLSIDVNQTEYTFYCKMSLSVVLFALYSIHTFVQVGFKFLYTHSQIYTFTIQCNAWLK